MSVQPRKQALASFGPIGCVLAALALAGAGCGGSSGSGGGSDARDVPPDKPSGGDVPADMIGPGSGGATGSGGVTGSGGGSGGGGAGSGGATGTGGRVDAGGADGGGDARDAAGEATGSDGTGSDASDAGKDDAGSGGSDGGPEAGTDATGSGGAGGAGSDAGGAGGAVPPPDLNYLERNGDPAKTGHSIRPLLTRARAMTISADTGFAATFNGDVWSSPLYVQKGPAGKGTFYVATAQNNVLALDETTGATVWTRNLGAPSTNQACGCCSYGIPQGIYGTPVIDLPSRTLFAVAAQGPGDISGFRVYGLDIDTGVPRTGWPVNAPFGAGKHNQRSALALVGGVLYVAFGGHQGDCTPYNGRVMAINIANPTMMGMWTAAGSQSAIWGAGGLASDGNGVIALTGNGSGDGGHQDSEEVIRITGLGTVNRTNANIFYPTRWQAMDGADLDFGCNAAAVFNVPGATPAKYVAAPAKDGHLYFLDAANFGGMGGEQFDLQIAQEGMSTRTSAAAYMTTNGMFVALSTGGARCPAGGATGTVVMGVQVTVNAGAIAPRVAWCAAMGGDMTAPIATTSDGAGNDAIVWYVTTGGNLRGVDGETGATIATGTGCSIRRWQAPIVGGAARIVAAAGSGKLCSWSVK